MKNDEERRGDGDRTHGELRLPRDGGRAYPATPASRGSGGAGCRVDDFAKKLWGDFNGFGGAQHLDSGSDARDERGAIGAAFHVRAEGSGLLGRGEALEVIAELSIGV